MLSVLKVRQAVQYFAVAASKMCGSVLDQCEIRCLKVVVFFSLSGMTRFMQNLWFERLTWRRNSSPKYKSFQQRKEKITLQENAFSRTSYSFSCFLHFWDIICAFPCKHIHWLDSSPPLPLHPACQTKRNREPACWIFPFALMQHRMLSPCPPIASSLCAVAFGAELTPHCCSA